MNNYEAFLDLLLDAESAAQQKWETEFTDELHDRWLTYGPDMDISESELNKLNQIAGLL